MARWVSLTLIQKGGTPAFLNLDQATRLIHGPTGGTDIHIAGEVVAVEEPLDFVLEIAKGKKNA